VLDPSFAVDANGFSDIGNTHLYTGRERDPETGLQFNRFRPYGSHVGRWTTRDPTRTHVFTTSVS
jgi:RHS repeat-associated protein